MNRAFIINVQSELSYTINQVRYKYASKEGVLMAKTYIGIACFALFVIIAAFYGGFDTSSPLPSVSTVATAQQVDVDENSSPISNLRCGGNEPFWSLQINETSASYQAIGEDQTIDLVPVFSTIAEGMLTSPIAVHLEGEYGGVLILSEQICSDGMSDNQYPWSVNYLTQSHGNGVLLTGCCQLSN